MAGQDAFLDNDLYLEKTIPFVPRIGDYLYLSQEDIYSLEKKIMNCNELKEKYSKWIECDEGENQVSLDCAGIVKYVTYKVNEGTIHVEIDDSGKVK